MACGPADGRSSGKGHSRTCSNSQSGCLEATQQRLRWRYCSVAGEPPKGNLCLPNVDVRRLIRGTDELLPGPVAAAHEGTIVVDHTDAADATSDRHSARLVLWADDSLPCSAIGPDPRTIVVDDTDATHGCWRRNWRDGLDRAEIWVGQGHRHRNRLRSGTSRLGKGRLVEVSARAPHRKVVESAASRHFLRRPLERDPRCCSRHDACMSARNHLSHCSRLTQYFALPLLGKPT